MSISGPDLREQVPCALAVGGDSDKQPAKPTATGARCSTPITTRYGSPTPFAVARTSPSSPRPRPATRPSVSATPTAPATNCPSPPWSRNPTLSGSPTRGTPSRPRSATTRTSSAPSWISRTSGRSTSTRSPRSPARAWSTPHSDRRLPPRPRPGARLQLPGRGRPLRRRPAALQRTRATRSARRPNSSTTWPRPGTPRTSRCASTPRPSPTPCTTGEEDLAHVRIHGHPARVR